MFGLFNSVTAGEKESIDKFTELLGYIPYVNRVSYRKNGIFEVIFESCNGELTDIHNIAEFHVIADAWIMISDNKNPVLHVGVVSAPGYRVVIDAERVRIGERFEDHDDMVDDLLDKVGLVRG